MLDDLALQPGDVHRREHVAHPARPGTEVRRRPGLVDEFNAHVLQLVDDGRTVEPRAVADPHHRVRRVGHLGLDDGRRVVAWHLERRDDRVAGQHRDAGLAAGVHTDDGSTVAATQVRQRRVDRAPWRVGRAVDDVDARRGPVVLVGRHVDLLVLADDDHVGAVRERVARLDGRERHPTVPQLRDDFVVQLEVSRRDDYHSPKFSASGLNAFRGLLSGADSGADVTESITTGYEPLDELLGGGFERGTVSQVYGPPAAGKTNIALVAAVETAAQGGTVVYVDTEGLSLDRFEQVASARAERSDEELSAITDRIVVEEALDFEEQEEAVRDVEGFAERADLVVVDSATGFYRLKRGEDGEAGDALRKVGRQVTHLLSLARRHEFAVLLTNQVFSDPDGDRTRALGGNTLEHWMGTVVRIDRFRGGNRRATLEKHRAKPAGESIQFEITDSGIAATEL